MYLVGIYIWRGKAYLPVQARLESGAWVDTEPVFIAELTVDALTLAVERVIAAGHRSLPDPTREEWEQRKDPVLAATTARSWKELARNGASYTISQEDDEIRVDMSFTDKKGRWQNDPEKVRVFQKEIPLNTIVKVILEDIKSRPEILR